jgi:hypothetical protein
MLRPKTNHPKHAKNAKRQKPRPPLPGRHALPPDPAACPGATGGHFCRFTRAQLPSALPLAWPRALARMIIARSHAQCARASAASHPAPSRARSGPTSAYRCCGPRWRHSAQRQAAGPAPRVRFQPRASTLTTHPLATSPRRLPTANQKCVRLSRSTLASAVCSAATPAGSSTASCVLALSNPSRAILARRRVGPPHVRAQPPPVVGPCAKHQTAPRTYVHRVIPSRSPSTPPYPRRPSQRDFASPPPSHLAY